MPGSLSARGSVILHVPNLLLAPELSWGLAKGFVSLSFSWALRWLWPIVTTGHCASTCPVHVPMSAGVCRHEHTGTGGQFWDLDTLHHPFLPSTALKSACRAGLGVARG